MKHIVKFTKDEAEKILDGQLEVLGRFSKSKINPFSVVSTGDLVYIRINREEVIGQFRVKKVIFFDGLDNMDIKEIKEKYQQDLIEKDSKFGTLIFIGSSNRFLTSPIKLPKKNLKAWMVF
jgi:hypothetical protein